MMESTLVADGADASAAAPAAPASAAASNPLFGGDDGDLFAPLEDTPLTTTAAAAPNGGSKSALMGQLLGEEANPPAAAAASPAAPPAPAITSKLSTSGLLESSSSGLFGDDDAPATNGGASGLFDDVDAEQAEQARQAAAAAAAEKAAEADEARRQEEEIRNSVPAPPADDAEGAPEAMHELNLNDANGEFMGMGMGLGGEIPISPHPAPAAPQGPVNNQGYQFSSYRPPGAEGPPPQGHATGHGMQPPPGQQPGVMNAMAGSYYYSTTGNGQQAQTTAAPRKPNPPPQPSVLAGMHVGHDVGLGGVAPPPNGPVTGTPGQAYAGLNNTFAAVPHAISHYVAPPPFDPLYGKIVVGDPMLVQGTGLFAGPPHWTYLVTVHAKGHSHQPAVSAVRRRFRHFVALEERLRNGVPGAILPPRPDKHPARAIEEATARQSAEFAQQRAAELGAYMTALAEHPHTGTSPELELFLTLQDHIGTAWPEVSSSAFTRMTAAGSNAVEKLTESVDGVLSELGTAQQVAAGEDSAEILALAAYEGRRIGAVSSSVPKIEGCVGLIRERGDRLGATGLEAGKLAKDVAWCDRDLAGPLEVLSGGLLRSGRRTKRLGLELGAAVAPFATQYRMCKYEQRAFADRRAALKRRSEARVNADKRASRLMVTQTSVPSMGRMGTLERMETEAAVYDEMAVEAGREADEIAARLQSEVGRIGAIRVREWDGGMRVVASAMREACAENAAIWESALEAFAREFPDCPGVEGALAGAGGGGGGGGGTPPVDQTPKWHASYRTIAAEPNGIGWDRVGF
ncbi:hypothetical protein ACHAXT_008313 [Thalassiosira profunda]